MTEFEQALNLWASVRTKLLNYANNLPRRNSDIANQIRQQVNLADKEFANLRVTLLAQPGTGSLKITMGRPPILQLGMPTPKSNIGMQGYAPTILGGATVESDKLVYDPGEAMLVTVSGGQFGIQEWVAVYLAANPDSTFSYQGNWQYIANGLQTLPSAPVSSYPITLNFNAPADAGTYDLRYFANNGVLNRLARSASFQVNPSFVPDFYASPTGAGNHSGDSQANAMLIAEFLDGSNRQGKTLGLMDGVYDISQSMIGPPNGMSGAPGLPITIKALNDGNVLLDGMFEREPLRLFNNHWFVIEGINFKRGADLGGGADMSVVHLFQSDNNIFRRIGFWDAWDDPTYDNITDRDGTDPVVVAFSSSSSNLFEDCFGFGSGRYIFYTIGNSFDNICRRCWFRLDHAVSLYSHPRAVALPDYEGGETIIMENCILEYRTDIFTTYGSVGPYALLEGAGFNGYSTTGQLQVLGCLIFIGPDAQNYAGGNAQLVGLWDRSHNTRIVDTTMLIHPNNSSYGNCLTTYGAPLSPYNGQLHNIIMVGQNSDSVLSSWNPTNVNHYSTIASVPDPYAYLRFRYVNGVQTGTPLWPWPMRQRILDATASSGWITADVHADVEAVLGPLP